MTAKQLDYRKVFAFPTCVLHGIGAITLKVMGGDSSRLFSVRARSDAATGLHGLNPRNTGHGTTNREADAALVQRLRQGERERDGQERAYRVTASLKGTWPGKHRSGYRVERADCTSHPAAAMGGAQ